MKINMKIKKYIGISLVYSLFCVTSVSNGQVRAATCHKGKQNCKNSILCKIKPYTKLLKQSSGTSCTGAYSQGTSCGFRNITGKDCGPLALSTKVCP